MDPKPKKKVRRGLRPEWIDDKRNQKEWIGRFMKILNTGHGSDATIARMVEVEALARACAIKIRSYVDLDVSTWLYQERKRRVNKEKKTLETALRGMNAAVEIYEKRNPDLALFFGNIALELSSVLGRTGDASETKRHGRDRAQAILYECRLLLESNLGTKVTHKTLVNLLSAGYEADGNPLEEPITESTVRKNEVNFKRNNPAFCKTIESRYSSIA
jgi:hypothetical protein